MAKFPDIKITIPVKFETIPEWVKGEKKMKIAKPQFIINRSVQGMKKERKTVLETELNDVHIDFQELEAERKELFNQLCENHKKENILMKMKRAIEMEMAYNKE